MKKIVALSVMGFAVGSIVSGLSLISIGGLLVQGKMPARGAILIAGGALVSYIGPKFALDVIDSATDVVEAAI